MRRFEVGKVYRYNMVKKVKDLNSITKSPHTSIEKELKYWSPKYNTFVIKHSDGLHSWVNLPTNNSILTASVHIDWCDEL